MNGSMRIFVTDRQMDPTDFRGHSEVCVQEEMLSIISRCEYLEAGLTLGSGIGPRLPQ